MEGREERGEGRGRRDKGEGRGGVVPTATVMHA